MMLAKRPLLVMVAVLFGGLLAGCRDTPMETVDPSLVGNWGGHCEIGVPVVFNPTKLPDGVERRRETIALDVTIREDASVEGVLGEATFEGAVLKHNRGDLGRELDIESDFIIADGQLAGAIVPGEDEIDRKDFSAPFNLEEGRLDGSLFWLDGMKYPYPLCELNLERVEGVDQPAP